MWKIKRSDEEGLIYCFFLIEILKIKKKCVIIEDSFYVKQMKYMSEITQLYWPTMIDVKNLLFQLSHFFSFFEILFFQTFAINRFVEHFSQKSLNSKVGFYCILHQIYLRKINNTKYILASQTLDIFDLQNRITRHLVNSIVFIVCFWKMILTRDKVKQ